MIHDSCTSNEWITEIARTKKADKGLVQKLIRALILLEGLSESNIKFVFKGGTALMLLPQQVLTKQMHSHILY